jgi:BMFP domain-containing protein YqiC
MATSSLRETISTLKSYLNQLSDGERTPSEVGAALNEWARESAESVKAKIAEEVEATVSKMGFIKREEYELLLARVAELEKGKKPSVAPTSPSEKSVGKRGSLKKSAPVKKSAKVESSKDKKKASK